MVNSTKNGLLRPYKKQLRKNKMTIIAIVQNKRKKRKARKWYVKKMQAIQKNIYHKYNFHYMIFSVMKTLQRQQCIILHLIIKHIW